MVKETPQVIDPSEGEHSDSEQDVPDLATPELDQLVLTAEEQQDFDSFALASWSMAHSRSKASLWKFSEEDPKRLFSSSDTSPEAQTTNTQA